MRVHLTAGKAETNIPITSTKNPLPKKEFCL